MNITNEDLFASLEFLRDEDHAISKARATRIVIEEGRKHLKARLIGLSQASSFVAKEQDAYSNPEYKDLLKALRIAIEQDEHYRLQVDYHKARIEVWRSMGANQRAIDRTL